MLYKFKSKAAGDLILLEPHGRRILEIIGKDPGPTGIIQLPEMAAAARALELAVACARVGDAVLVEKARRATLNLSLPMEVTVTVPATVAPFTLKTAPVMGSRLSRRTSIHCATISQVSRLRVRPSRPVAQKEHARAQPTCDEMQRA